MSREATGTARAGATGAHDSGRLTSVTARVRNEYEEMPGLCLTRAQAQRLLGLDPATCDTVLSALVDEGYLRSTTRGFRRP